MNSMILRKGIFLVFLAIILPMVVGAQGAGEIFSLRNGDLTQNEQQEIPLSKELQQVERKFGVQIFYKSNDVKGKSVRKGTYSGGLEPTLNNLLQPLDMKYQQLAENSYVIMEANRQKKLQTVSGTVTDAESNETLPGVNVVVKGTTSGTSTGSEGQYELNAPSLQDTLVFSFIGYQTQEVPIDGRTTVDVALETQTVTGEEMVVVGYGTQQVKDVTGSISTVNSEDLNTVATSSVNQMLRGKAAGLNMRQVSAQPGGDISVNIRGNISPQGSGAPLYVIDGVPITNNSNTTTALNNSELGYGGGIDRDPLSYLNPSDIESISVMKDASSTAIYGSAAANGVVLITTKSGASGDIQVEYRGSYTVQTPHEYFPLLNSEEFMRQNNRLARDQYLFQNRLAPYGDTDPSTVSDFNPRFDDSQIEQAGTGTDWLGRVTEKGSINEHDISLSGGSENTVIYSSFNFQGTDGVLANSTLNRFAGRLNVDQYITDNIQLNVKTTASRLTGSNASTGDNDGEGEKYNMLQAAYTYSPTVGVYNEDGSYASTFDPLIMNPAAFLTIDDESQTGHFFTAPKLTVDFLDNLTATVIGQVDIESSNRSFYLPRQANNAPLPEGMAQKSENSLENYTLEGYVEYQDDFENSSLTLTAGGGYYKTESEGFDLQAVGFFTDAFSYNNVGVASNIDQNDQNSWKSSRTKLSQFARANYSIMDRYILSASVRRDGSSIFAENNKYGYFPGGSVAWRISEEDFTSDLNFLSNLKARVSYGMTGNETVLQGNALQLYSTGRNALIGDTQYTGVSLGQIANPDLTWEKNYTFNIGLDYGFFSNRISGTVDYYVRTAKDLLDFNPLPSNNPIGEVADNVGSTQSRGFEVSLNTQNVASSNFQWNTNVNVSYSKASWVERNPRTPLPDYIDPNGAMDTIYGWETDGLIRSEDDIPDHMPDALLGNVKYVDQNGDDVLDSEDVVKLGNEIPRWNVGLDNTFSYKNLSLNVFLYGNFDFERGNNYVPSTFNIMQQTNPLNTTVYAKDIFSVDNRDGEYAGVASNPYDSNNPEGSDYELYDASFVRIQNVSLSYTLPTGLFGSGSPLNRARVFLNLQDLGVISKYPGFDPELTETNPYPRSYSTTVGIELNL